MTLMAVCSTPIAGRTEEEFCQLTTIAGEHQEVLFTKTVTWVVESESRIQFIHGGKVLRKATEFSDYTGYLTSLDQEQSLKVWIDDYQVTPESTLEVQLVTRVFLNPLLETEESIKKNAERQQSLEKWYQMVPDEWRKITIEDGEKRYPPIHERPLNEEVTFSSKNTDEENAELVRKFKETWSLENVKLLV